jgi:threonine dehydratase
MPRHASFAKVEATQNYGAEVMLHGETFDEAMAFAKSTATERGLTLVHAYDDPAVMAGQGTVGLEIVEALADVDAVLVPVGGGGLLAGVALAVKSRVPRARVIGVQSAAAPAWESAFRSRRLAAVVPSATVADGIAVGQPGSQPAEVIWRYADDIVAVPDERITRAMVLLLEWGKLLVEGAGAVGIAALLEGTIPVRGKKVAVLLSGGNLDPTLLARVVDQGLAEAGRFMMLRVVVLDRPGRLAEVLSCIAATEANVVEVNHHRAGLHLPIGHVELEVLLETKNRVHGEQLLEAFRRAGYEALPPIGVHPMVRRLASKEAAHALQGPPPADES